MEAKKRQKSDGLEVAVPALLVGPASWGLESRNSGVEGEGMLTSL